MELIPELCLGWLNGWVPILLLYAVFGVLLAVFPRAVVKRLYDRSHWSRGQRIITAIGRLFALACMVLIVLTPLKVGSPLFLVGTIIYVVGLVGFVVALINYRNTPLDEPVTRGLYRISRNPQQFMLGVVGVGIAVACGSWLVIILMVAGLAAMHQGILAEEASCLAQYGESYRAYMTRVPRYFLFF